MKNSILLFFLLCTVELFAQGKLLGKPSYAGVVEFAGGGFGGYNYPVKGDSVLVYTDYEKIDFRVFSAKDKGPDRDLHFYLKYLKLVAKKEFLHIESIDRSIPTGKYDMKFIAEQPGGSKYTIYLTHYSDGTSAELNILGENEGTRLDNICLVKLVRIK